MRLVHGTWIPVPSATVVDYALCGIQIFFGLSGFLIATRLLRERALSGRVDLRSFYIRRAHRILPPVLVFLTVAGVLGAAGGIPIKVKKLVGGLLFFPHHPPRGAGGFGDLLA